MQKILGCSDTFYRAMNHQAFMIEGMPFDLVTVRRQERKLCDQINRLTQDIVHTDIIWIIVIRIERQDCPLKLIHDVRCWNLDDHIFFILLWQIASIFECLIKFCQLLSIRAFPKQKQIDCFFKTETLLFLKPIHQVKKVITTIVQSSLGWNLHIVFFTITDDGSHPCDAN